MRQLVVSTYTGLGRRPLTHLLHDLADAGYERVEILATPPHVDLEDVGRTVADVVPVLRRTGLQVTSVVPSGVDVNLASTHGGMRRWSQEQFLATVRLAAALGAGDVVVHPGRRHPLRPPPTDQLLAWVLEGIDVVTAAAEREGVHVLLENVPTGLFDTAQECVDVVHALDGRLGICYDVANGYMVEDVPESLRNLGAELRLVHVSDTRRSQWRHDPLGTGEVPWHDVAVALAGRPYTGRVVLETLHQGDPVVGFDGDAAFWTAALQRVAG